MSKLNKSNKKNVKQETLVKGPAKIKPKRTEPPTPHSLSLLGRNRKIEF